MGLVTAAGVARLHMHASSGSRDVFLDLGLRLRESVGMLLAWDSHATQHATIAVWGPLVIFASLVAGALLPLLRRRTVGVNAERFANVLGPWLVVELTVIEYWFTVGALLCAASAILWLGAWTGQVGTPAAHAAVLISVAGWLYVVQGVEPWVSPIAWSAMALGSARLAWTTGRPAAGGSVAG